MMRSSIERAADAHDAPRRRSGSWPASGLMTRPISCTATNLFILTMPVSVSTETSAICTPPTPLEFRPIGIALLVLAHPRRSWWRRASCRPPPRSGSWRDCPSPGCARPPLPVDPAARPATAPPPRTASPARSRSTLRVDDETPPTVVDPPDPPDGGSELSPMFSLMALIGRPSVSAATCTMIVRVPVPRSWLPSSTSTEPSGLMTVRHLLVWPPPPQVCMATPRPRFTGPGAGFAARMPVLLPVDQLLRLAELRPIDLRARGVVGVLVENLDRIHIQLGGQILDRAAGQEAGLLVVRRAPGALRRPR